MPPQSHQDSMRKRRDTYTHTYPLDPTDSTRLDSTHSLTFSPALSCTLREDMYTHDTDDAEKKRHKASKRNDQDCRDLDTINALARVSLTHSTHALDAHLDSSHQFHISHVKPELLFLLHTRIQLQQEPVFLPRLPSSYPKHETHSPLFNTCIIKKKVMLPTHSPTHQSTIQVYINSQHPSSNEP